MKKIFIFLLVAFTGAILTGCSQEDLEINEPTTENKDQGHYVSLDQALIRLMPFYNEAAGTTRSSVLPLVTNLERLPVRNQTRSSEEVAPYYIVNFADNAGFAVLSADDRLLPVYAFSTSGHIALEDTVSNPTLSYFFNSLLQQEADNINLGGTLPNPWEPGDTIPGLKPVDPTKPYEQFLILVSPLLAEQVSQWNQDSPYNNYIADKNAVGCAAISVGQICSFHGIPKNFKFTENKETNTINLDWAVLRKATTTSSSINTVAKFLSYLGSEDLLKTTYGKDYSSTETENIISAVRKLGFSRCDERDYNIQTAKTILKSNRIPFMVIGRFGFLIKEGEKTIFMYQGGADEHIFVIDGIASYVNGSIESDYVHCVWGLKDSRPNGYFYNPTSPSHRNILPTTYKDDNGKVFELENVKSTQLWKLYIVEK